MNKISKWVVGASIFVAILAGHSTAHAQGRRGFGRGGGGFDPAEVLKRRDANGNGIIEPSEAAESQSIRQAAARANLDITKPIPVDKLLPAMKEGMEEGRRQDGSKGLPPNSSPGGFSTPPPAGTPRPTFGPPSATKTGAAPTIGRSGGGSSRAESISALEARFDPSVVEYVNKMLKEQDKNGDGSIDNIEWKAGKWNPNNPPENSDLDKDGKLSREELCIRKSKTEKLPYKEAPITTASATSGSSGPSSSAGLPPGSGSSPPSTAGSSSSKKPDKPLTATSGSGKRSYRFLTPTERLPKGMPDWFLRADADGDGQVLMSEYSASWTEATATEFAKLDLDGDGIITPRECLAGEKK